MSPITSSATSALSVSSMTGFGNSESVLDGTRYRCEIKSLNHRFLEIRLRLPKEFQAFEFELRAWLQSKMSRGSLEFKIETTSQASLKEQKKIDPSINFALAASYHEKLLALQKIIGLGGPQDPIRTIDIALLPEVITLEDPEKDSSARKAFLFELAENTLQSFFDSRRKEGEKLATAIQTMIVQLQNEIKPLRELRQSIIQTEREKIREKVAALFELYPLSTTSIQVVLESRISQELALLIDRTDIEEELTRIETHLNQLSQLLQTKGPIGRKLDFLIQELHREANTLGNKSTTLSSLKISETALHLKSTLEQIKEQAMNIE